MASISLPKRNTVKLGYAVEADYERWKALYSAERQARAAGDKLAEYGAQHDLNEFHAAQGDLRPLKDKGYYNSYSEEN